MELAEMPVSRLPVKSTLYGDLLPIYCETLIIPDTMLCLLFSSCEIAVQLLLMPTRAVYFAIAYLMLLTIPTTSYIGGTLSRHSEYHSLQIQYVTSHG